MYYIQFDRIATYNYKKIIKIGLFIISFAIILSSIIYIYISNNSNTSNIHNTRRKIDKIEYDITNLYNYTETMSEFMVDNYNIEDFNNETLKKQNEIILNIKEFKNELINETLKKQDELILNIKELKNELINKTLKKQDELIKDINEFKNELINKTLKKQDELIKDIKEFKLENYNLQNNFRKLTLRNIAIEYITKYKSFDRNNWFAIYNLYYGTFYSESSRNSILNLPNTINNYFEKFLNIDYEKFIISFAYYSNNEKENIIKNPIYNIINTTLYSEYDFINNMIDKNISHYDFNNIYIKYDEYYTYGNDYTYSKVITYYGNCSIPTYIGYFNRFINIVLNCNDERNFNNIHQNIDEFRYDGNYKLYCYKNPENNKLSVINMLENYEYGFQIIKNSYWINSIKPTRFM
jgi:hypothetical protein